MVDPQKRKEYNKKFYERHKSEAKKRYEDSKEKSKEKSDAEVENHLSEHPLDLNYGQKPVKSSFPSFGEWLQENSGKSWQDYIQERGDFLNDQPRELTNEEMMPYLKATSDGCCIRCGKELDTDGRLCMNCRLEIS